MNPLQTLYSNNTAHTTPSTRNLPNGGGSYNSPGIFTGADTTITPPPAVEQPVVEQPAVEQPQKRSKYMNPATGKYYTPEEYANSVAVKIPASKGTGDVTQYAGDALSNPNESANALNTRATNLNNTRNDIATGTTDPYKAGNKSGVAYSPRELKAIESAYAGVYDPALNDVFSRLKTQEDAAKRDADREDRIFATNESIRQWRATTGTKTSDAETTAGRFTSTQLNKGAIESRMTLNEFTELDPEIANYFINPPKGYDPETGETFLISESMKDIKQEVLDGKITNEEAAEEIMAGINIVDAVKVYLINQLPASQEEKDGWIKAILSGIWGRLPGVN